MTNLCHSVFYHPLLTVFLFFSTIFLSLKMNTCDSNLFRIDDLFDSNHRLLHDHTKIINSSSYLGPSSLKPLHLHTPHNRTAKSIPILSISINSDNKHYISRLLLSIDHPIDLILIQIGNSDKPTISRIIEDIEMVRVKHRHLNIYVTTSDTDIIGLPAAMNFGLRILLQLEQPISTVASAVTAYWILIISHSHSHAGVYFHPGALKRIARSTERQLQHDRKFGIGFVPVCVNSNCTGCDWSAVVLTKKLINVVGIFDENFYPGEFAIDDFTIRMQFTKFHYVKFNHSIIIHREEIDKRYDCFDGANSFKYLENMNDLNVNSKKEIESQFYKKWQRIHEVGSSLSRDYLTLKWGLNLLQNEDNSTTGTDVSLKSHSKCKLSLQSRKKMSAGCMKPYFSRPFNNLNHSISFWQINSTMREYILKE